MKSQIWHLKKEDDSTYGPVDLTKLRQWAEAGRVGPEDSVSPDGHEWAPAPDLPELEMDWFVEFPTGERYGPLNRRVFADMVRDGTLSRDIRLEHKATGERVRLDEIAEVTVGPAAEVRTQGAAIPVAEVSSPAPVAAAGASDRSVPPSFRSIAQEKDQFEREAQRWRGLYEEERSSARATEQELQAKLRARQEEEITLRAALDNARRETTQLKRLNDLLGKGSAGGDEDFAAAYHELSRSYDTISGSYAAKVEELRTSHERLEQLHKDYRERVRYLEEQVEHEREDANAARRRLAELEESYQAVVQSLREMNDRYIRIREKAAGGSAGPAPTRSAQPSAPAEGNAVSTPSSPPEGFAPKRGPRIRLTR